MNEDNGSLDKIAKEFDTTFESTTSPIDDVKSVETALTEIQDKKNELTKIVKNPELVDQKFMRNEIKILMMSSKKVLLRLESDIKIGTEARMFEVYAKLLEAVTKQLTELRQLNETIQKIENESSPKQPFSLDNNGQPKNRPMSLTSEQLLDLIDRSREKSQMKSIDTTFTVEESDRDSNKNLMKS